MAHPFSAMFEKALKKSTSLDNQVLEEAEDLRKKGYGVQEIYDVLKKLSRDLVRTEDSDIVAEAAEEFSKHLDDSEE